jgi:small subunit ribosomal protein S1
VEELNNNTPDNPKDLEAQPEEQEATEEEQTVVDASTVESEISEEADTEASESAQETPAEDSEVDVSVEAAAETPEESDDAAEDSAESEGSWEEQLEESLASGELKRGEIRDGTIIDRRENGLVVDVGGKRDGFVPNNDIQDIEDIEFEVGSEIPVLVTRVDSGDGNVRLSVSQALEQEDWLRAEKLMKAQDVYETTVTGSNRGGLTVDFGRIRGFIPMSQIIGFNRIRNAGERQRRLSSMVDDEIMVKVIEVNRRRQRLILSQRAAAKEWRAARREDLLEDLESGQVRSGRISQITDFGLFVNLGGLDGLVHISELSWGRIENPGEIYRPGQRVKVKVLNVDQDRERIALSIKALKPDPWETVDVNYTPGDLVEGKVTQVVDFGAFIELEPGVEGLLHNSEFMDFAQREELEQGQDLLVKIIRIEPNRRRIGLSVRQVRPIEWENWVVSHMDLGESDASSQAEEVEEEDVVEASEDESVAEVVEDTAVETEAEAVEETQDSDETSDEEASEEESPEGDEDAS